MALSLIFCFRRSRELASYINPGETILGGGNGNGVKRYHYPTRHYYSFIGERLQ